MKKPLILLSLMFIAGAANATSLTDSMVLAYKNNPQLRAKEKELMARDEQVPQAYSGWLPQASFNDQYGRTKYGGSLRGDFYNDTNTRQLTVVQPLFNGGETYARIKKAYNVVNSSREDLKATEQDVLNQAISAHMDLVRDYQVLDLSKHNEVVLKEQMESTKDRFKLGETTKTDVAQSEARYAKAISDTTKARGQLTSSIANYLNAIGLEKGKIDNPASFQIPSNKIDIPATLDEAINIAMQNNHRLKLQKYREGSTDNDVDIAYANILPDLNLRGNKTKTEEVRIFPGNPTENDSVTLNLTVPLYQSGAEYSRVREAKRLRENSRLTTISAENQVREDVIKAWQDVETSRSVISSDKQTVEAATVALNGVKQEAEVGARTVLDVLDAEQELFTAKVNLVNSQRNEIVALYNLRSVIGDLTAADLKLPVETFDPESNFRKVKYQPIGF